MVGGWRFWSLRVRLIVILCGFLALTLGTLGVFLNEFNTRAIEEQTQVREELLAKNIQVSINQVLFAGKYQAQAYIESVAEGEASLRYVAIIDGATRRVIAHSDPAMVGRVLTDPVTTRGLEALAAEQPVFQRYRSAEGETLTDWSLPYLRGYLREPEGIIRVGISGQREAALLEQSRLYTFALIGVFMVAGAALAVGLSFRITAGLGRMTAAASRFGRGDYQALVPVPATPRDELDQLGLALNQMASQLGGYSERLENQVRERTEQLATANRHLRESEERLKAFLDNATAVIFMKDLEGRYILINRAFERVNHQPREQLLGKTDLEISGPEVFEVYRRNDLRVIAEGRPMEFEEHATLKDGPRTYLSVKFPLRDATGAIYAVGGVATDITQRQELEATLRAQYEKLKELDRLKSEFVNAVSHDLRTPLTSIRGYSEFLEDHIGGELTPQQQEFVTQIQKGALRLENLVDDLLDFARIEAGTFKLRMGEADFREPVAEIVDSLKPQAEEAHLRLGAELPDEPLVVRMDARRIQQVLTNLLHNAIKFTPAGGQVTVRARREGGHVRCEVADTGPGIAPEDAPKLFQRFSQLQRGMAKGGTGLGLSISKAIIESHGGAIGVESEPGEGSTFWFTLPAS